MAAAMPSGVGTEITLPDEIDWLVLVKRRVSGPFLMQDLKTGRKEGLSPCGITNQQR